MNTDNGRDNLVFFGRMNAHISHELRNILATISETAGLLEDLISLAGRGKELDKDRLVKLAGRVTGLVARGNQTVRNMNRFSHTMDDPVRETDLNEEVGLMVDMSHYVPRNREVVWEPSPEPLPFRTRCFELQHLLYTLMVYGFSTIESDERIKVQTAGSGRGAIITFSGLGSMDTRDERIHKASELAAMLGGEVHLDDTGGVIEVVLLPPGE